MLLIWADTQWAPFQRARALVELGVSPVYQVVDWPYQVYRVADLYLTSKHELVTQNEKLKRDVLELNAKANQLKFLAAENQRLQSLLHSTSQKSQPVMLGRLLRVQTDPFSQQMIVDQGLTNGVFAGQPVIDKHGLVGIVKSVGSLTSRILLITDPSMAVPVESLRSGARSIALGSGAIDSLELQHVSETADFKVGDILVTSGLGGQFYPGYPVGTITSINRDLTQAFDDITVKPSAALHYSREVLLVGTKSSYNGLTAPMKELDTPAHTHGSTEKG